MADPIVPQGLPGATPCNLSLFDERNLTETPVGFVPIGIDIYPTDNPLANFLLETFAKAEVPPVPTPVKT